MAANDFKYFLPEHGGDISSAREFESLTRNLERLENIAEEAAYDYHSRGGYEDSLWPITLTLLNDKDEELGTFEVERRAVPEFEASRV